MENYAREARLRAIAMNAVREARLAYERVDDPFSDDDAVRAESIFQLLHVQDKVAAEYEHFPLINKEQAPSSPKVIQVANILEQLNQSDTEEYKERKAVATQNVVAKVKS